MSPRQQANALCQQAHQQVAAAYKDSQSDPRQLAESVDLYVEALELDPKYDEPYLGLAYLSFVGGDKEQALQLLHQAAHLNPINMRTASLRQKILRTPCVEPVRLEKLEGGLAADTEQTLDAAVLMDHEHQASLNESPSAPVAPETVEPPTPSLHIHPDLGPVNRPGKISQGPEVKLLQRLLQRLGFQITVNSEYDGPTLNAVKNFQYRKQINISGLPDPKTCAFLNHMLSKLPPDELLNDTSDTPVSESDERLWEEAEMPTSFTSELGPPERPDKISSGPEVLLLQELLLQLQFSLEISGLYDKQTFSAIRNFQSSKKLPVSGMVDAKTRMALNQVLEQTFVENTVQVEFMQQIWQFRKENGQSITPLQGLQLNKWLKQLLQLAKTPPATNEPLYQFSPPPERILIASLLSTPGQMHVVSQGLEVLRLQETLVNEGFSLEINGQFDLQTFTAVKDFQQAHHCPVTGSVEGETRQVVNQYLGERYAREEVLERLWNSIQTLQTAWGIAMSENTHTQIAILLEHLLSSEEIEPIQGELGPSNRPGKISQGHEVALLKWILTQLGYALSNQADVFDTELYNELRKFQQKHQLPMTGLADEKTRHVVNGYLTKWGNSEHQTMNWVN